MWRRAALIASAVGFLAVSAWVGWLVGNRSDGRRVTTDTGITTTSCVEDPTTTTTTTSTIPTSTTTTTTTAPPTTSTTAAGPDGLALEQRLSALGYWLGEPDGVVDDRTKHAVVAFQKVQGLARDGVVGPRVRDALAAAVRPVPRSKEGRVIEIDLARQVILVADANQALAVLDASTGRVAGTTPIGRFKVTRQIDGYHRSPLGVLYRPKYFYEGVAVHGYPSVPPYPASHGCVRTTNAAMDWLWASGRMPVGAAVWVYR